MSRLAPLLAGFVVMLAACAAEIGSDPRPEASEVPLATSRGTKTTARSEPTSTDPPPEGGEEVEVIAVLDGDSLAVELNGRQEVRLAGINTPERDECHGDESRDALEALVDDGTVRLLEVEGDDDRDQFGRLLRNVWVGGTWVNRELVASGDAISLQTGSADEATLVSAEDAAWQDGLGLWGADVCGSFVAGVRITDLRYDPPGRDFENTEEEWVLLANEGDVTVEMGAWIVRDESSTHRYVFPAGFALAPGDGVRLRTGCGTDQGRDLYWCAGDAVWSNGGDTVLLQTAGGTVVDRWKYAGDF